MKSAEPRLVREAKLLASLSHPGIAAIYSFEEISGRHVIAMEIAEGETLEVRLRRGPVPPEEALALCRQIAEALEAAHQKGIVHRGPEAVKREGLARRKGQAPRLRPGESWQDLPTRSSRPYPRKARASPSPAP